MVFDKRLHLPGRRCLNPRPEPCRSALSSQRDIVHYGLGLRAAGGEGAVLMIADSKSKCFFKHLQHIDDLRSQ